MAALKECTLGSGEAELLSDLLGVIGDGEAVALAAMMFDFED